MTTKLSFSTVVNIFKKSSSFIIRLRKVQRKRSHSLIYMKGKIITNPQDILNQINKICINVQVQLRTSKGKMQNLLAEITNPLIVNAKCARDR